jgi:hypothetical protein
MSEAVSFYNKDALMNINLEYLISKHAIEKIMNESILKWNSLEPNNFKDLDDFGIYLIREAAANPREEFLINALNGKLVYIGNGGNQNMRTSPEAL